MNSDNLILVFWNFNIYRKTHFCVLKDFEVYVSLNLDRIFSE
jgi:hypothetical protein